MDDLIFYSKSLKFSLKKLTWNRGRNLIYLKLVKQTPTKDGTERNGPIRPERERQRPVAWLPIPTSLVKHKL